MAKANGDGAATGPQIPNELSDDQRFALTEQHKKTYIKRLAEKKAADKALQDLGKEVKADLGKYGLKQIKDMIDLETPEGEEKLKAEMESRAQVMRWLGMDIGTQAELFGDTDRRPVTEKAFAEGKAAGIKGEAHKNPYHQTNPGHGEWQRGWEIGQNTVMKGFKKLDTEAAADSLAQM